MLKQFVRFSIVGVLNTAIHYGVFYGLYEFVGLYYILASGLGFCLAVANSFIWNKYWTFRSKGADVRREFVKFFIRIGDVIDSQAIAVHAERVFIVGENLVRTKNEIKQPVNGSNALPALFSKRDNAIFSGAGLIEGKPHMPSVPGALVQNNLLLV